LILFESNIINLAIVICWACVWFSPKVLGKAFLNAVAAPSSTTGGRRSNDFQAGQCRFDLRPGRSGEDAQDKAERIRIDWGRQRLMPIRPGGANSAPVEEMARLKQSAVADLEFRGGPVRIQFAFGKRLAQADQSAPLSILPGKLE